MQHCLHCRYYVREPEHDFGSCHGNPPVVMLLPTMPTKEQQIASGGRAQGFTLQTVRPTVKATDVICNLANTHAI
ncbi:MAG: hypothetical protein KGJ13_10000 [Patescibacteria group bacterium]|nr:hypothetical protein [Patescibacteria group bacterium]